MQMKQTRSNDETRYKVDSRYRTCLALGKADCLSYPGYGCTLWSDAEQMIADSERDELTSAAVGNKSPKTCASASVFSKASLKVKMYGSRFALQTMKLHNTHKIFAWKGRPPG